MAIPNPLINLPLDINLQGHFSPRSMTIPEDSMSNEACPADMGLDSSKQKHERTIAIPLFDDTVSVAARTVTFGHIPSDCTLAEVAVVITGAVATGADRKVNVDIIQCDSTGVVGSVLTASITHDTASTLFLPKDGTVSVSSLSEDDVLRAVVSVAGAAGAQAKGLLLSVTLKECDPIT